MRGCGRGGGPVGVQIWVRGISSGLKRGGGGVWKGRVWAGGLSRAPFKLCALPPEHMGPEMKTGSAACGAPWIPRKLMIALT
jgi:hypothetical protein